jgi:hypothetical protein
MLVTTKNPDLLNSFINDPAILPFIGFDASDEVDYSHVLARNDVVAVHSGDEAMMVFHRTGPACFGLWEKHTLFRDNCRGRRGIATGIAMLDYAKNVLGARGIWSQTPVSNRRACWFNRQIGMVSQGFVESDLLGSVEHFVMEHQTCH